MGKIETATQWMIDLANDDSHGYDQDSRWGPDYDCSSSVISAWQYAGVPVKTKGASSTYDMKNVFLSCGFTNVISSVNVSTGAGLKRGDVLHRSGHTAMYIGNNKQVAAHLNEKGTTKGGKTGDQTGKEISVSAYSNSSSNPWFPGPSYGCSMQRYSCRYPTVFFPGRSHRNVPGPESFSPVDNSSS